jgi:cytosine/adenosine deaminase-related metal-dependent hydrolase
VTPSSHLEWTLTARWVFPVEGPPLHHGTVTVRGDRIAAVEPRGCRTADLNLGNRAVLPGLVNAHTHLDLTGLRDRCPPTSDIVAWLRQVIAHRRAASPTRLQADIRAGLAESLRYGTTLLGDIASAGASWDVLAEAPLRAVVFHELLGLTERRADEALIEVQQWLDSHPGTATCRPGLSPHAPYSVRASLFQSTALLACRHGLPVAIHVAESPEEFSLLTKHSGSFVPLLTDLGVWDPAGLIADWHTLLQTFAAVPHVAWIHANYLPDPAAIHPGMRIVCPRTRAAFRFAGGPEDRLRWPESRSALGTDSLASNPDLDVLAEARFLSQQEPEVPGPLLLRMATLSGAEALGWQAETGSLTPGKSADLVAVNLPQGETPDPHQLILGGSGSIEAVLFRGRWVQGLSLV